MNNLTNCCRRTKSVGIRVFPEREEVLIGSAGFVASGGIGLRFERIGTRDSQPRQRAPREVHQHTSVIKQAKAEYEKLQ